VIAASLVVSHLLPSLRESDISQPIDSEHELYLLHHEPSTHFCSLAKKPLVCAHGGDLEVAPPNTLTSFQAALDGGADCVEVDVSMTKDGELVALHDRDLAALLGETSTSVHTTTGFRPRKLAHSSKYNHYRIGDYTWDQLSKLQWNKDGSGIALLQDVLEFLLNAPLEIAITLDIKLKDSIKETLEAELMAQSVYDVFKITNCGQYCMVWAKSDAFISQMKSIDNRQRVGLVVLNETSAARTAGLHEPLRLQHLGTEVTGVHYSMATVELTQLLQSAGKKVYYWTANSASMMKSVLDAGADAVVTSYPRKLTTALQSRAAACARERRRTAKT
jgi:glycerophosphoryl diester phosphodiesterase